MHRYPDKKTDVQELVLGCTDKKKEAWKLKGSNVLFSFLALSFGIGLFLYVYQSFTSVEIQRPIRLSPYYLPLYAFFSLTRVTLAYGLSFLFSLFWGYWAAKDKIAERVLLPLTDVLQSIPVLGFIPGLLLLFTAWFPNSNLGVELSAIMMVFTAQAWNMALGVYQSIRGIPKEQNLCATAYGFSVWQRFRWVELPSSAISLIYNSMMSVAASWFFLMLDEGFQLGTKKFLIPGLGSYMSTAAAEGDILAMIYAILTMITLIVFLDVFVWRPLIVWSQKFRIENSSGFLYVHHSSILEAIKKASCFSYLAKAAQLVALVWFFLKRRMTFYKNLIPFKGVCFSRLGLGVIVLLCCFLMIAIAPLLQKVPLPEWVLLGKAFIATFLRVMTSLTIGAVIVVPLALIVGLSDRFSSVIRPFFQIAASFPASLLFPFIIWFFHHTHIPLNYVCIATMVMGSLWYLFFNVLAGISAIPADLQEVAKSFHYNNLQKTKWLYLPAIFPYFMTGVVAASGAAWNTSIIAEYISYRGQVESVLGLGSLISRASQEGNNVLLAASVFVMIVTVALWNYFVWLKLYRFSEKRCSLNV